MGYALGIDVGTTFTAAAVARDGRVEIAPLGNHAAAIPSLVFLREDDAVVIGDAAARRGFDQPTRLAKEFKRRFGDSTPIMLDRTPVSAERLTAMLLRQVVLEIRQRHGGSPDAIGIAHPANWGQFKIDLLRQAVELADLIDVTFVTEPVAAAVQYASTERVEVGDNIAVYDLGGGTFDAAVLRKTPAGFETLGQPQGIERLGGIDFDEAVFNHVRRSLGDVVGNLDSADAAARGALMRLRQECVQAKEALSSDSEATIPVLLPNVQTQVRLTRAEFEDMIRPTLRETVETLRRAMVVAGVQPNDLRAILLVGGSSRIPLVAEMVNGELGRPVVIDTHPKHSVALGAARVAAGLASGAPATAPPPPPPPTVPVPRPPGAPPSPPPPSRPAPPPTAPIPAVPPAATGKDRRVLVGALVALAVLIGAGVLVFALTRGDDDETGTTDPADTTEVASDTTDADDTVSSAPTTPDTEPADTSPDSTAPPATETDAPTTTAFELTCGASGRCAGIREMATFDIAYVAFYETEGFEPVVDDSDPDSHHVHFFFDTLGEENAGMPVEGQPQWAAWGLEQANGEYLFNFYTTENQAEFAGDGATQMCIAVANFVHEIELDTVSCVPLPG